MSTTATSASCAHVPYHDVHKKEFQEDEDGVRLAIIDLSDPDRAQVAKRLHEICSGGGFFFLTGHGIPGTLQQQALQQTQSLFDLPLAKKVGMSDPELSRGYTAMQEETLDVANQTVGDAKEGFYLAVDIAKDDNDMRYDPAKLRGPNQWPDPADLPEFKTVMNAYFQQLSDVAFRLVQLLALSLGLDEHFFDAAFTEPMAALRLLHYNAGVANSQKIIINENDSGRVGIYGCGAHSDYGMITLLLTDGTPGLQIQTPQQKWLSVLEPSHYSDNTDTCSYYVVNLGDMLERWTNGLYKSTVHRVILPLPVENDYDNSDDVDEKNSTKNSRKNHRYSIPFFYEPNFDTVVECLPTCVAIAENRPAKYPPIKSGQYLLDKYRQTHADFTPTTLTTTRTTTCSSNNNNNNHT